MIKGKLILRILTPEGIMFDGEVNSVFLPGVKGRFEVLDRHAPIISALSAGEIKWRTDNTEQVFPVSSGVARVEDNIISVCAQAGK